MPEETAKDVILKCVNALELLPEETPTVKQLSDGKFFSRMMIYLKNEDINSEDTETIVAALNSLLKEHFAGPKLVCFEAVVSGDEQELVKVTLLLLYITMVTSAKLNSKLIHSPLMDSHTQLKLKYLIESIQKRGSGMSSKFLDILCQEKIDAKTTGNCQTPVTTNAPWGSPTVYSSSPKTSVTSPLRELVQSPTIRMQKLINAKVREVKDLQQEIHARENEKQETEMKLESSQNKISKLTDMLAKYQEELKDQRQQRDELEARMLSGEDFVQQQIQRMSKELSVLRKENTSLQENVRHVVDENDELTSKNKLLHTRLTVTTAERERLEEELSTVVRAKMENEIIIDEQAFCMHELKAELEELRQCLENSRTRSHTIEESFEYSPVNFQDTSSPHPGSPDRQTPVGNRASVVIDKILEETREQLVVLQEQHQALQNQLKEITDVRSNLQSKVESLTFENESITRKLEESKTIYVSLQNEHSQLMEQNSQALENLKQASFKIEELAGEKEKLLSDVMEGKTVVSGLQGKLSSLSDQLKNVEEQLLNSQQEVNNTKTTLREVMEAKNSVQKEYAETVASLKEDQAALTSNLKQNYEVKIEEMTNNLNMMLGESENLRSERTALQEQLTKQSATICTLESELKVLIGEKSSLLHNIDTKSKEYIILQQQIEKDVEVFIQEKNTLMKNLEEMKNINLRLQEDMNVNMLKITGEKVALDKALSECKNEFVLIKEEKEKLVDTLSCLEKSSKKEIEVLREEKENLIAETLSKEECIRNLNKQIELEKKSSENCRQKELEELKEKHAIEQENLKKDLLSAKDLVVSLEKERDQLVNSHTEEKDTLKEVFRIKENELVSTLRERESLIKQMNEEKVSITDSLKLKEESLLNLEEQIRMTTVEFEKEESALKSDLEVKTNKVAALELQLKESQESYEKEKYILLTEIESRERTMKMMTTEQGEAIEAFVQEKSLLSECIREKEEKLGALQLELKLVTEKLCSEKKALEMECHELQQELERTKLLLNEENTKMVQDFKTKEERLVAAQNEMKENLALLKEKNNMLNLEIKSKDDLLNSGKLMLDEKVDAFVTEKGELMKTVELLRMEINQLTDGMNDAEKQHSLLVEQLQNDLVKTAEDRDNWKVTNSKLTAEINDLKEELKLKISVHNEVFTKLQSDMKSKVDELNQYISEKEKVIQNLQGEKREAVLLCTSKVEELEEKIAEFTRKIESSTEELKEKEKRFEERESDLRKEISGMKEALATAQMEKEQEMEIKNKKISKLSSELDKMVSDAAGTGVEYKQAKIKLEEEIAELNKQIQELGSDLKEKQDTYEQQITSLTKQITTLENEKKEVLQENEDRCIALAALAREFEINKEKLDAVEGERKVLNEVLLQERKSASDMMKTQEDALNSLKEKVENVLHTHSEAKETHHKEIELKILEIGSLKKELEGHLKKCEEEKSCSRKLIEEKEVLIDKKEKEMNNFKEKFQEEKEVLSQIMQEKEDSYKKFKEEMDREIATLKAEKAKEVAAKEKVISNLEKEKASALECLKTERAQATNIQKAKEETLILLQEKMQENNDSIRLEKDSLLQNLLTSQKDLAALQRSHDITKESFEKEKLMLTRELEEKRTLYLISEEKFKAKEKECAESFESVQQELELVRADLVRYKDLSAEVSSEIGVLKEEKARNALEHTKALSSLTSKCEEKIRNLCDNISEKNVVIENLEKANAEIAEKQAVEVKQLEVKLLESSQQLETLKEGKLELERNEESSLIKIQSLNNEITDIKSKLKYVEETLNEKESMLERDLCNILAEKEAIQKTSMETIDEMNKNLSEKSEVITHLEEKLQETQSTLKSKMEEAEQKLKEQEEMFKKLLNEKDLSLNQYQIQISSLESVREELHVRQAERSTLGAQVASLEEEMTAKEEIYLSNMEELKKVQQEKNKYLSLARSLEAKLIDKEKEVTAGKEELMRIEREAERSQRSLSEELQAAKEKYRAEGQALVDKIKSSYKTEMEKIMIKMEEQEKHTKEAKLFQYKYETAKKKWADSVTEQNELKKSNEDYQEQIKKFKEHIKKLNDNLKKEQLKNADIADLHHPLKEKLKESEQKIRRLDNENRTLEAQVRLADSQMRDMKRQMDREKFNENRIPMSRSASRAVASDSQLIKIAVSKPRAEGQNTNDSVLSQRSTRTTNRRKVLPRAASVETVFKKPESQSLFAEAVQNVNIENLATAATNIKRKDSSTTEKSVSDKSIGHRFPKDMVFNCEDEEEQFSNKFLLDLQFGRCNSMDDAQRKRLSELQRRNSLYPPHMRSAYPAELQFASLEDFDDDMLRAGCAVDESLLNLTEATGNMQLDSPAFNLRKRKSLSDSTNSEVSIDSIVGKKNKRLSTSYSRPGPPTPGRRSMHKIDKENILDSDTSQVSSSSREQKVSPVSSGSGDSPVSTRSRRLLKESSQRNSMSASTRSSGSQSRRTTLSPGGVSFLSKKGLNITPRGKRVATPLSIKKILSRGKSPWRKLESDHEVTRKRTKPEQLISCINRAVKF
ncbi:putative leucine-rich repeat-containing protein DDB_G0290503 isoform X2 [Macrobrachium rosenbergii]|uniref:putative leucine-rich repeat-containing protein DDB_G0290503 isoform X2 n=1 Tax=Macrobrachium rosenbergii TaxID=79674 RepID=UPI0034D55D1B